MDSGSSDGSVAAARALEAQVVELDRDAPFTAARARNAGVDCLLAVAPQTRLVQFVDGDCEVLRRVARPAPARSWRLIQSLPPCAGDAVSDSRTAPFLIA